MTNQQTPAKPPKNDPGSDAQEQMKTMLNNSLQNHSAENQNDIEYMPALTAAHKRRPNKAAPILLFSIAAFFVIAVLWANWAKLDEITRGDGRVIPSGQIKVIDHLEGGIVRNINVKEGMLVKKDQLLLQIDNTVAETRHEEARMHFYRALTAAVRIKAQLSGKSFVVPQIIEKNAPEVAAKELDRYNAAQQRMKNETAIATHSLEQRQEELIDLQKRASMLEEQYKLTLEELNINIPLAKQGIVAKVELIRLKREVNNTKGDLESTKINIRRSEAALEEAQERLQQVAITMHTEDLRELKDAERRLSEMRDVFATESDKLTRTDILSPVNGIIKELMVHTIGGVIQPGQDLLAIVPLEDTLLIEAQIRPADVAFLRPGLHSIVKITAYDFAIYGGLDATLVDISADSIEDEQKGEVFFRVRLKTKTNHLVGRQGEKLPITPGMVASVDILTGKKTVLHYLLKPIRRGLNVALTEK